MTRRKCVGGTRAPAATIMVCLALLCAPALSVAAEPDDSRANTPAQASEPLAPGAGYGQPQGDRRVRALQRRLRALGMRPGPVDGIYGPLTEKAVKRLQRHSGLSADGIVGTGTRRVLNAEAPPLAPGAGYGQPGGSDQVRAVQRRLRELGHRPGPIDGLYGPRTRAAIERFQRSAGRPASGVLSSAPAEMLANSGATDRSGRTPDTSPAVGSAQSRTPVPIARPGRVESTHEGETTSLVPWAVVALALIGLGGLSVGWLMWRRRRPEESAVVAEPTGPKSPSRNGSAAASHSNGSAPPATPVATPRPPTAAALGYVSVRDPEATNGHEVQDQMAAIEVACRHRGLELTEVVRDPEPADAPGPKRVGMQHALHRLDAGEASCLVVADLGRLSRSAPEVGTIVESLRRRETRLVAVGEGLDTDTESGSEAADKLMSMLAAIERRPTAPRNRPRPKVPEPTPSALPDRQAVLALRERIRAMRANGMTLQAIADRLNAENVPTLRGGVKWRPSGVQAAAGYRRRRAIPSEASEGGAGGSNGSARRRRSKSQRATSGRRPRSGGAP
jgi:peptidoglycan hydrolase-like protein with peptidoglycan-binding domain/DNA invertase Pin-like site-specific DNA recombinase